MTFGWVYALNTTCYTLWNEVRKQRLPEDPYGDVTSIGNTNSIFME